MEFSPPLQSGILVKRYRRFLTDILLDDGSLLTIHCPNTGSMKQCHFPGERLWYSTSSNPKRKYPHTWELAETPNKHLIGINTHRANALVKEAILANGIPELSGYENLRAEVKYGEENSRIDFLLQDSNKSDCYLEVKSCTLLEEGMGYFPDAVTLRGQKHLRELMTLVSQGKRAVLLFAVQHTGISCITAAKHIDEDYAKLLKMAHDAGVEIIAYTTELSPRECKISAPCGLVI